jgi:hypothetical protein
VLRIVASNSEDLRKNVRCRGARGSCNGSDTPFLAVGPHVAHGFVHDFRLSGEQAEQALFGAGAVVRMLVDEHNDLGRPYRDFFGERHLVISPEPVRAA